jgi:hypothetical protein
MTLWKPGYWSQSERQLLGNGLVKHETTDAYFVKKKKKKKRSEMKP